MCLVEFLSAPLEQAEQDNPSTSDGDLLPTDEFTEAQLQLRDRSSDSFDAFPGEMDDDDDDDEEEEEVFVPSRHRRAAPAPALAATTAAQAPSLSLRNPVNAQAIQPLTPTLFIHSVLMPELIVSLLRQDLRRLGKSATVNDAIQLRDASTRYGSALFPVDARSAIDPLTIERLRRGQPELARGTLEALFAPRTSSASSSIGLDHGKPTSQDSSSVPKSSSGAGQPSSSSSMPAICNGNGKSKKSNSTTTRSTKAQKGRTSTQMTLDRFNPSRTR